MKSEPNSIHSLPHMLAFALAGTLVLIAINTLLNDGDGFVAGAVAEDTRSFPDNVEWLNL